MFIDSSFDNNHHKYCRTSPVQLNTDISVIEVGYNRLPDGYKQIFKRDIYVIHYISDGAGTYLGQKLKKNHIYTTIPHQLEIVKADAKSPIECYWIVFTGSSAKHFMNICNIPNQNSVIPFPKSNECIDIIKECLFYDNAVNEYEEACMLSTCFYKLMSVHMQTLKQPATGNNNPIAQNIKTYFDNNYHSKITINALARQYNYTRNNLFIIFKNEFGISPQEYLINLRISKSKQLLSDLENDFSVAEVAFSVGFDDPLYFSRIFHKKIGMSPTVFKRNAKER